MGKMDNFGLSCVLGLPPMKIKTFTDACPDCGVTTQAQEMVCLAPRPNPLHFTCEACGCKWTRDTADLVIVWKDGKPARIVPRDLLSDLGPIDRDLAKCALAANRHLLKVFAQCYIEAGRPPPGPAADTYDLAAGFLDLLNDHHALVSAALAALRGEAVPEKYQDHPLVRAIRETIEGRINP